MGVVFEAPSNAGRFDPHNEASNQILDRRKPQIFSRVEVGLESNDIGEVERKSRCERNTRKK